MWEGAHQAQYAAYLRHLPPSKAIEAPWRVTSMLPDCQPPAVATDLFSTLIQRRPGCADVAVQVVYPNLALTARGGRRCLIVSHGHFIEPCSAPS